MLAHIPSVSELSAFGLFSRIWPTLPSTDEFISWELSIFTVERLFAQKTIALIEAVKVAF